MLPSSILFRYLARNYFKWFVIVAFGVVVVILLVDLSELLRKSASKTDITFMTLIQLLICKLPSLIELVLPFIIFFSSILMLWMLNRSQEFTIIRSIGISIWQALSPLIAVSLVIGGIDLMIINPISSKLMLRYEHLNDYYFHKGNESLAISDTGLWVREAQGKKRIILHIKHVDLNQKEFQGITLTIYDKEDYFIKSITAAVGSLNKGYLNLKDVWVVEPEQLPVKMDIMELPTSLTIETIKNTGAPPMSVSFWELPKTAELLEASGISGLKYMLQWHSLIARWFWLGAMVILAASCSLRPIRQQGAIHLIIIGAIVAFLLYFLRDITFALGSASRLPLILSAWFPFAVSIFTGAMVLLYSEDG